MPLTDEDIAKLSAACAAPNYASPTSTVSVVEDDLVALLEELRHLRAQRDALQARGTALVLELQRVRDPNTIRMVAVTASMLISSSAAQAADADIIEERILEHVGVAK